MSIETREYLSMLRRMLRAAARRVAGGDEPELADLVRLRDDLEQAIAQAVTGQREQGRSWQGVADGLGVTRQAAQMRYGRLP